MCGRFTNDFNLNEIINVFNIAEVVGDFSSSYNIAPGQNVPVIVNNGEKNLLDVFRWGLIPPWAKDIKIGYKMINARSETITEKPSFKNAFHKRRCLMVANGFFEWKQEGSVKVPYFIHLTDRKLFGFASIWEKWRSPEGQIIQSCSIITTEANEFMKPMHHRMPIILPTDSEVIWLNPAITDTEQLKNLLKQYPSNKMKAYRVSRQVNSPVNNAREFLLPLDE